MIIDVSDEYYEDHIIECYQCNSIYLQFSYCKRCGPLMSISRICDLMHVVVSIADLDINSSTFVSDVYFLLNYLCGRWYEINDYAYQMACYKHLRTLPSNPWVERALYFFGNVHSISNQ